MFEVVNWLADANFNDRLLSAGYESAVTNWLKIAKRPLALVLALVHLILFRFLDERRADGPLRIAPQSYVSTASNIIANTFGIALKASLAIAFSQISLAPLPSPNHEGFYYRALIFHKVKSSPGVSSSIFACNSNILCTCSAYVAVFNRHKFPSWCSDDLDSTKNII